MRHGFTETKFQSFTELTDPANVAPRLAALRQQLEALEYDAFIVPLTDAFRGESIPDSEQRLAYITGFTGSAGFAIIAKEKAALFVDGRYTLQAPTQTDQALVEIQPVPETKLFEWIIKNLPKNADVAYDPWLHTHTEIKALTKNLKTHAKLVASENLVDKIWSDRPAPPLGKVELLGANRAGLGRIEKLKTLQKTLKTEKASALVLNMPESICWLFNIRGRDVPNTPVVHSFAIVPASGKPTLFVDAKKLGHNEIERLSEFLNILPPSQFDNALAQLGTDKNKVWVDPAYCPSAITTALAASGAKLVEKTDPILLPKAKKNQAEVAGMREAHKLDGVAMAKFLSWFDANASSGELNEIDIATALEAFRRQEKTLVDISFDTISGSGPNGAIVHYRVTNKTNRTLNPGEIMLVDSGGQYLSGTTDITRTMFTGSATPEQKDRFTRVLIGMIAISTLQFPKKTTGSQIDVLARHALWQVGLNYNHGTGHGVGAFLSVHEQPGGISPRNHTAIVEGMIISNEPGFYLEGAYGIRIENLVHVIKSDRADNFLAFETLTLAPIDKRLIETDLLSDSEINWLNAYHSRVFEEISPTLDAADKSWLQQATCTI